MSILIRGMEMPTSCGACRFCGGIADTDCGPCAWCDVDGKARVADTRQDCPLVTVPPHGRLIDADELAKRIKEEGRNQAEYYADRYAPVVMAYGDCYGKVQSAPTIIPASEEGK